MSEYSPRLKTEKILDRAYELVRSVPYQVSARWLFYRLLQEGYYSTKQDYSNKFIKAVSTARHAFYKGWRPDTLADETREAIRRGDGFESLSDWLEHYKNHLSVNLNKWYSQDTYIELWFEARAMADQFRHYTQNITLRPMGGQPSIPYKYQAAQDIDQAADLYGLPVVILYFGDLDLAGSVIAEVVERDVCEWCYSDFEFIHCGLTPEQVQLYNVPENIEHPGAYQWEALTDDAAHKIITENINKYLRHDAIHEVETKETDAIRWLKKMFKDAEREWKGEAMN